MYNILIVPYTESLGHAGRALEFVNFFLKPTESITIAGGGEFDYIFPYPIIHTPQVPYRFLKDWSLFYLPGLPFFDMYDLSRFSDFDWTIGDKTLSLDHMTERWLEILAMHKPDIIFVDARPDVYWAAQILEIPIFGILSYGWTELFERQYCPSRLMFSSRRVNNISLLQNFNNVGTNFGKLMVHNCWQPLYGQGRLIADSSMFISHTLPKDCFLIGPQIWSGTSQYDLTVLNELDNSRPIIYITSGTSHFPIFEQISANLISIGCQVIISGGVRNFLTPTIEKVDDLYVCKGLIPGSLLIKRSDLIICHGGSQSLYQAASAGVFALVIPQHFDHERNGIMFADQNLAYLLPSEITSEEVSQIILRVLNDPRKKYGSLQFEGEKTTTGFWKFVKNAIK